MVHILSQSLGCGLNPPAARRSLAVSTAVDQAGAYARARDPVGQERTGPLGASADGAFWDWTSRAPFQPAGSASGVLTCERLGRSTDGAYLEFRLD